MTNLTLTVESVDTDPGALLHLSAVLSSLAALLDLLAMFFGVSSDSPSLILALIAMEEVMLGLSVGLVLLFMLYHLSTAIPDGEAVFLNQDAFPGSAARWSLRLAILVIVILEVVWRLEVFFASSTGHSQQLAKASLVLDTLRRSAAWTFVLKYYGGILFAVVLGVAVAIGSLTSFAFSEKVTGRFLRAVSMVSEVFRDDDERSPDVAQYILLVTTFVLDFNPDSIKNTNRWTIISGPNQASSFVGIASPRQSTFRVSPPNISTPSLLDQTVTLPIKRPQSLPRPMVDRRSSIKRHTSSSARFRNLFYAPDRQVQTEDEETLLRSRSNEKSMSPASSIYFDGAPPSAFSPGRRSSGVHSVVGIKRTPSSPGARLLILGTESVDKLSTSNRSSESRFPPIEDLDNFPPPPTRRYSRGLSMPVSSDSEIDFAPPVMPAARAQTSYDVTSFIESGNARDSGDRRMTLPGFRSSGLSDVLSERSVDLPPRPRLASNDGSTAYPSPTFSDLQEATFGRAVLRPLSNPADFDARLLQRPHVRSGLPLRVTPSPQHPSLLVPRLSRAASSTDSRSQMVETSMPESPTIPPSAGEETVTLQRAFTTSRAEVAARYGRRNVI
ncbi:hypothetical protein P7C73_g6551, partial [Tremellales sp. Uapishka_1]